MRSVFTVNIILAFEKMQIKAKETPKITVAIRKRPISKKELQKGENDIVRVEEGGNIIIS